jgi:hypothetical protein
MKFSRVFLAGSLALGLSVAVQANTTDLGLLADGDAASSTGSVDTSTLAFSDTSTFSLASQSDVSDIFTALKGVASYTVSLFLNGTQLDTFSGAPGGSPSSASATHVFDNLAASLPGQHYSLLISGNGKGGATYFNALSVSAVPEADTWVMLIAGAGLVGFQLRRKQQSLPQRPFF